MTGVLDNPGQGEGARKVGEILTVYSMMRHRLAPMRQQMLRNYKYVVGDQLDKDVLKELEAEGRPAVVMNILHAPVLTVAGHIAGNKIKLRAVPVSQGDEGGSEMHTKLVSDWAIGDDGYYEIGKASIDAVIAKIGWVNQYVDFRRDPEGKWMCEALDPFTVLFDPDARKLDQTDWRYLIITRWLSCEEILRTYTDLSDEVKQKLKDNAQKLEGVYQARISKPLGWYQRVVNFVTSMWDRDLERSSETDQYISDFVDVRNGTYRVLEFHDRRDLNSVWIYSAETREKQMIPKEKEADREYLNTALMNMPGGALMNVPSEQIWLTVAVPGLLADELLLEKPHPIQGRGFQVKPIYCYDFHPDVTQMKSLVDDLISPQDDRNQRQMTLLEWIMDSVNPNIDAPDDSVKDYLEEWQSKERGVIRRYKVHSSGAKPEPRYPNPQAASALRGLMDEDKDLISKISGVSLSLAGHSETSKESGVLYSYRVQQALGNLSYLMRHIQETMRHCFNFADRGVQEFVTAPRAIRLLSDEQDPYWLQVNWPTLDGVLNDVTQGEYDFLVDLSQMGSTTKQLKFLEAMEFAKAMPAELVPWQYLAELWDSPIASKVAKYIEQRMGVVQGSQEQQMKLQAAAGELGLAEKVSGMIAGPVKGNPRMQAA